VLTWPKAKNGSAGPWPRRGASAPPSWSPRAVAWPLAAIDSMRWGMVVGRVAGVPGECVRQYKRRRGSSRSLDTGGAEEKIWVGDIPSNDDASVGRWSMLGSLQHQDDEGEMRGGPIEGEGQCKGRLPEEWTHGDGGFKNGGADDSSVGERGGRVVEGHREEGGGSLRALLVRRGGMGKERTAMVTGALHRGTADNFVVKKWKGKGRGAGPMRNSDISGLFKDFYI
jgi:hypothetical protein